jgi:putative flippase GtrA
MKRFLTLFLSKQFLTFLAVGGTAALLNFLMGAALRLYWTSYAAYVGSVAAGFALGTVVSFVLNRRFTFRVTGEAVLPQAVRFGIITLGSIVVSLVTASALFGLWGLIGRALLTRPQAESLGHLGAIGLSTIYNFLAMKFFAFRRSSAA